MGIKDEFNCCSESGIDENIDYLRLCFERGYKPGKFQKNFSYFFML